jgi:hypothetical protein
MHTIDKLPCKIRGMSSAEYHGLRDFDSRSYLSAVARGGGELQQWLDSGRTLFSGNAATKRGGEFDELVQGLCEGKTVASQLRVPPEEVLGSNGSRSTKAYKAWEAEQTDVIVCTADQAWQYERMVDSLMANTAARDLVENTTETQMSVFFDLDGHPLKVRPDGCCPDRWWDLKTTSAKWDQLYRSVYEYGYGEQEWLYVQGAVACGYAPFRMPFVFVQTSAPFACHVLYLPIDYVAECGDRMQSTMELVRLRRETGEYLPLDYGEIRELEIPSWVRNKEEVY